MMHHTQQPCDSEKKLKPKGDRHDLLLPVVGYLKLFSYSQKCLTAFTRSKPVKITAGEIVLYMLNIKVKS